MEQEKVHVRLLILAGVAFLWMTAVFGRLTYLQLIRHSEYMSRAMRQQKRTIEIDPKRGTIFDRNMRPLAMSVPVQSAFAIPAEIKDTTMAARLLSGERESGDTAAGAFLVEQLLGELASIIDPD